MSEEEVGHTEVTGLCLNEGLEKEGDKEGANTERTKERGKKGREGRKETMSSFGYGDDTNRPARAKERSLLLLRTISSQPIHFQLLLRRSLLLLLHGKQSTRLGVKKEVVVVVVGTSIHFSKKILRAESERELVCQSLWKLFPNRVTAWVHVSAETRRLTRHVYPR